MVFHENGICRITITLLQVRFTVVHMLQYLLTLHMD